MTQSKSLAHRKRGCKYHIVWIPKYRKKRLFGELCRELGPVLRELASHGESKILEECLRLVIDHVHILISIPPKYAVSQVVGYIKRISQVELGEHQRRTYLLQHDPYILVYSLPWENIAFLVAIQIPEPYSTQVESSCLNAAEEVLATFQVLTD